MSPAELNAYLERTIPEYAQEKVQAGYWSEEDALEKSRKEYMELLPDGVNTKNNFLFTLKDNERSVGLIWFGYNPERKTRDGFVYELYIEPGQRGKGYGKKAMLAAEEKARELGLTSLALHVFGTNQIAQNLYRSLGYEVASLNMSKKL